MMAFFVREAFSSTEILTPGFLSYPQERNVLKTRLRFMIGFFAMMKNRGPHLPWTLTQIVFATVFF